MQGWTPEGGKPGAESDPLELSVMMTISAIPPIRPRLFHLPVILAVAVLLAPGSALAQTTSQIPITDATTDVTTEATADATTGEIANAGSTAINLKLPRFASLRADEVNLRAGPGTRYPIEWVYKRRNLPVEVIDEFDTWRRIRDWQGTEGWVHQSMLNGRRSIIIVDDLAMLQRDPQEDARGVARLEAGVIGRVDSCGDIWCVVTAFNRKGWLRREQFYGVYPGEEIQ